MKRSPIVMDIEKLMVVAGYCHWIPITQGLYKEYFSKNFPGWRWNDFIPRLLDKKVIRFKADADDTYIQIGQGFFISKDVEAIEFIPNKSGANIDVRLKV